MCIFVETPMLGYTHEGKFSIQNCCEMKIFFIAKLLLPVCPLETFNLSFSMVSSLRCFSRLYSQT